MPIETLDGPKVVSQLVIALYDNGSFGVHGPIDNKLLAYGMLEVAKDTVTKHADKLAAAGVNIIQAPPGAMAGLLKAAGR